jgi:cytochrome c oxidase subunit II
MVSRGRLTRWGIAPLLVLLSAVLFGGCDSKTPTVLDPKGPVASTESDLFWIILVIATIIFVAVTSVLVYSIVRFRERPGMPAPRQTHGNTRLEIAWTIAPSIVLFIVLIFTITYMFRLAEPASASTMKVTAIGHQWWWEFQYEGQSPAVVTGDELHVPVGTVVHVDLRSDNVIHSFWIPKLTGKTDVIPGHNNALWFKADQVGTYRGECAEFCGTQHANMDFIVVADPPDVFQSWLSAQQTAAMTPITADQRAGLALFRSSGCAGCHAITGVNTDASGRGPTIGPNLTHFASRQLIAGGVLSNTHENLVNWISDPQGIKPGNDMVIPVKLTPDQVAQIVAYLESLK